MKDRAQECSWIILLNNANRPVFWSEVSRGSQQCTLIPVDTILTTALLAHTPNILLVHNHPSSQREASADDIDITRRLRHAAAVCGLKLLDHIVVCQDEYIFSIDPSQP